MHVVLQLKDQSKAFERSVTSATLAPLLSTVSRSFSIIDIRHWCAIAFSKTTLIF